MSLSILLNLWINTNSIGSTVPRCIFVDNLDQIPLNYILLIKGNQGQFSVHVAKSIGHEWLNAKKLIYFRAYIMCTT